MDLAIYIVELLGLKGEVSVPGIGYFAKKRINGFYNEREGKFYPPHHEISFDPQPRDDDELASYISEKKNISPASAKYFIEKYTATLKQEASQQKVDIDGLGYLYYEYSALAFKADKKAEENDPSFYGLTPAKAVKKVEKPAASKPEPPIAETPKEVEKKAPEKEPVPAPVEQETEAIAEEPEDGIAIPYPVYEEEETHSSRKGWVIALLVIIIGLLCFGVAYQYKPEWFGKKRPVDTTIIVSGTPPAQKAADSAAAKSAVKDSATVAKPVEAIKPSIDTFAIKHYDLLGGTFKSLKNATAEMTNDKALGLNPRLSQKGNYYTITLGTFFNKTEVQRVHDSIFNIKGIHQRFIYIQNYIPKKK